MKNRVIIYIFCSIILIIIVCFFCLFKYSKITLDENLLNKKWYHYDNSTGVYNIFYMDGVSLSYSMSNEKNNEFNNCNKYVYNRAKNELNLDCGKSILINEVSQNYLVLTINSKKIKFFENVNDSLNYEFETFFNKSISEYKLNMKRVVDLIKINYDSFVDIYNNGELSNVIFFSNSCSNVECVLSLDVIEKWINHFDNIYYVDINEYDANEITKLSKLLSMEESQILNGFDGVYPRVLVFENKNIIRDYELKCNGFDCSLLSVNRSIYE